MSRRAVAFALALLVLLAGGMTPAPVAAAPNSLGLNATYDVQATLRFAAGTLSVRSTATVTNPTSDAVDALAFNLLPAKIGAMDLEAVTVDGAQASASVTGQTVTVALPSALKPDQSASVLIAYSARLNSNTTDKNWLFAKLNGVATAYRWIPWLSRAVRFKRPNFGDPFVTATSRSVRVSLTSDRALMYAVTGRFVAADGLTKTFAAQDVRDFSFAASPKYRKLKGRTKSGIRVHVYSISLPADVLMRWAKRSLNRFGNQVGAYPYRRFVVAQTEGGTGMESPAMIWIPRSTRQSNLPYLVAHETAHQWFYGAVGSDQAGQPFADEAPADFLARDLLSKRRASRCAVTTLDRTLYDYGARCYYEVIYIQGGNYLHRYRQRVGADRFWAGMRNYYRQNLLGLGGTQQLLETLDAAAGAGLAGGHEKRFPRYFDAD